MKNEALELGWCGGRSLQTSLEKEVCNHLSLKGIPHFHRPRRFQVTLENDLVGAYSPAIIIRGKGREGKTLVIEVIESISNLHLKKISSFRKLFTQDFFLTVITTKKCFRNLPEGLADQIIHEKDLLEFIERISF